MNSAPPPWIYRLAAIAVCVWATLLPSGGGAVPFLPSVLLFLALAWADATGGGGEQDGATWSVTVRRLLGPTVLPFYLSIAAAVVLAGSSHRNGESESACSAMACGVCGTVGAPVPASAPAPASASVAAAPSMCGGSKGGCGASGGGACGCGGGGHGPGSKAQSGSACGCGAGNKASSAPSTAQVEPRKTESPAVEPPSVPAKPVPVPPVLKGRTMQALPARSLPGISPTARPLPPGLKPNPQRTNAARSQTAGKRGRAIDEVKLPPSFTPNLLPTKSEWKKMDGKKMREGVTLK
jgi:hypothetical protein